MIAGPLNILLFAVTWVNLSALLSVRRRRCQVLALAASVGWLALYAAVTG